MPRARQRSVQSMDSVPGEIGDAPRSVPTLPGGNPTPSPLNSLGQPTPNPPPPTTDLGELIAPECSTGMPMGPGPGNPMFDVPPNMNSMPPISSFSRPHMGPNMGPNMGPMGHHNHMGPGGPPSSMNHMGPGGPPNNMNHMGPGGPPNSMNHIGPIGPPNSINHMGPGMPPNSMNQMGPGGPPNSMNHMGPGGPANSMAAMMAMGFGPKGGGPPMHTGPPGGGKIYPPNQPMVFNPSNPNAPPIYPCGYCHKEVHDNDQAILCESGCNFWFHRPCTGLTEPAYHMLTKEVYAEWACDKCLQSKTIPLVKLKP